MIINKRGWVVPEQVNNVNRDPVEMTEKMEKKLRFNNLIQEITNKIEEEEEFISYYTKTTFPNYLFCNIIIAHVLDPIPIIDTMLLDYHILDGDYFFIYDRMKDCKQYKIIDVLRYDDELDKIVALTQALKTKNTIEMRNLVLKYTDDMSFDFNDNLVRYKKDCYKIFTITNSQWDREKCQKRRKELLTLLTEKMNNLGV